MGLYNKKGMYSGYDKNHKERDALDYYSTPTEEMTNILDILHIDLACNTILEPSCGGGHMIQGILNYLDKTNCNTTLIATDVQKRNLIIDTNNCIYNAGLQYDFLSDEYPYIQDIDWIIMNPPFSTIEPFIMKSLDIADRKSVV